MDTILKMYNDLFPKTNGADWFYALLGLFLHALFKLKTVPLKRFKWKIFLEDFGAVWAISILSIVVCLGTLPIVMENYSYLDSALIGYSSSSIMRQILKQKISNLGQ